MKAILIATGLAFAGIAMPASAASLLGETVTINEQIGSSFLAYGYYSGSSSRTLVRTLNSGMEVAGALGDTLGSDLLPTSLDIDVLNKRIWFRYSDYVYGALVELNDWTVSIDLGLNSAEQFSGISRVYNDSAYQGASASWTGNRLTFHLSGGFANNVFRFGPQVFSSIFEYSSVPNQQSPTVPEPASWALMLGGFGLIGAALRRRGQFTTVNA